MRVVCFGSGEFGVPTFDRVRTRHEVVAVVTQPDRPAGRKRQPTPTPVAGWALAAGLPVVKSPDVNTQDFIAQIAALEPQGAVVIAFGQKLGQPLIDHFPSVAVNLHASLLPRYRGAAPINWAIIRGDTRTGLTVISLAQRMDAGLIYAQIDTAIDPTETAGELHDRLSLLGPGLMMDVLHHAEQGTLHGLAQDEASATKAPKMSRRDARVDFDVEPKNLRCRVHGLTPWPGAKVRWHRAADPDAHPLTLILLRVAEDTPAGDEGSTHNNRSDGEPSPGTILEGNRVAVHGGAVRILELQLPGRRALPIDEFVRGHPLTPGDRLTAIEEEDADRP